MYKNILHATDLYENHFDLCQKAVSFANSLSANIYFIHVIEIPSSLQWAQSLGFVELATPIKEGAEAVMGTLAEALGVPRSHFYVDTGSIYSHIFQKIKELQIDLIILGSQSNYSLPGLIGSTAHAVLYHSPCDVLTLRVHD